MLRFLLQVGNCLNKIVMKIEKKLYVFKNCFTLILYCSINLVFKEAFFELQVMKLWQGRT